MRSVAIIAVAFSIYFCGKLLVMNNRSNKCQARCKSRRVDAHLCDLMTPEAENILDT
jgi:hypothetical protein